MTNITLSLTAVSLNTLIALLAIGLCRRTFSRRIADFTDTKLSLETDLNPLFTLYKTYTYVKLIHISNLISSPEQQRLVRQR